MEKLNFQKEISAALSFLESQSREGNFPCSHSASPDMSNPQPIPLEVGSSMIVLNTALRLVKQSPLKDSVVKYLLSQIDNGVFHFFENVQLLPPDVDTTAYGISGLFELNKITPDQLSAVATRIVKNKGDDGLVEVYFRPSEKPAVKEPSCTADVLYLMGLANRRNEFSASEEYVMKTLLSGEFLKGTKYYSSPDMFLYFIARACQLEDIAKKFKKPTIEALNKRMGSTNLPLDLALRIISAKRLGIKNEVDIKPLIGFQRLDGSFPAQSVYNGTTRYSHFGSPVISTAFAIEALAMK